MDLHAVGAAFLGAVIPLVAHLGLVPIAVLVRVAPPRSACSLCKGGTGGGDQGDVDHRALLHRHAPFLEMDVDGLINLLSKVVLLQQVPERQDHGLVSDPVADHVNPREPPHRRLLDQGILHGWIAERVPLLHQVNQQQLLRGSQGLGGQRVKGGRLLLQPVLGFMGLEQGSGGLPGHHHVHLRQKPFPLGLLLGDGLLVGPEPQLLAAQ